LASTREIRSGRWGFLGNIQLANFKLFADLAALWTGNPVKHAERRTGTDLCPLDAEFQVGVDTLIVISFEFPKRLSFQVAPVWKRI
jgi:hypothetical protein